MLLSRVCLSDDTSSGDNTNQTACQRISTNTQHLNRTSTIDLTFQKEEIPSKLSSFCLHFTYSQRQFSNTHIPFVIVVLNMKKRLLLFHILRGVLAISSSTTSTSLAIMATQPARVGKFSFMSCYIDIPERRVLNATVPNDLPNGFPDKNNDDCAVLCAGFAYMGTEYGEECTYMVVRGYHLTCLGSSPLSKLKQATVGPSQRSSPGLHLRTAIYHA